MLSKFDDKRAMFLHPNVVTILATYRCTAACTNCCMDSNPTLTERVSLDQIKCFIDEAFAIGSVRQVVFSGGECFLLGEDLDNAVSYASSLGFHTRCVTNGYWALSLDIGEKRIRRLKECGLNELNISTGDFHQQWVPQERVVNAALSGVRADLDHTLIVVEITKTRRVSRESLLSEERLKTLTTNTCHSNFGIIESPWMPMVFSERIEQPDHLFVNKDNLYERGPCDSIFNTIVLTPQANVGLCCGLPREKIPELNHKWRKGHLADDLSEACSEFIKIWISVDGPEKILAWAASKNGDIVWENLYAHSCHACARVYTDKVVRDTILEHYNERVDDVLLRYAMRLQQQRQQGLSA